jgi:hypothetical protein
MGVPAGMGMPTGAQHWGAAGAGAYMVPTSMGMLPVGTPMQAMHPGVGGYMMVPGAYMMAGVSSAAPSAWPPQWQQFQQ